MLNKTNLENALKDIFENLSKNKSAADAAKDIADAIHSYVSAAEVASGIAISGTSPAGPVTGATSENGVLL